MPHSFKLAVVALCLLGTSHFSFATPSAAVPAADPATVPISELLPWKTLIDVPYGTDAAQTMDVLVPRLGKKFPTIVLIHGGGWVSGDKRNLEEIARRLARDGFTVANINYRLANSTSNHYPDGIDDARAAVTFLKTHATDYKVDANRMISFGTSAGGNLAIELGMSHSVKAVIDFYGPTNFTDPIFMDDIYAGEPNCDIADTYFGCTFVQDPTLYYNASPLESVTAAMPPTLIFHGELDDTVPLEQSTEFYQTLQALGVWSDIQILPRQGHGFLTKKDHSPEPYLNEVRKFLVGVEASGDL